MTVVKRARTAARTARSLRHLRLEQVLARVRLTAKRRVRERLAPRVRLPHTLRVLPVATVPPASPLPSQSGTVSLGKSGPIAMLPGVEHPLTSPVEWHPAEMAKGTRLAKLHLHYMTYLAEVEDDEFERLVDDWLSKNMHLQRGYWRDHWNSYAISIRVVVWMQEHARRRDRLSPRFMRRMERALAAQLDFLARNLEKDVGANHLVKNIKALLWGARFFGGRRASGWGRRGVRLLLTELPRQVLPDGMHYERSPAYHAQVLGDLIDCRCVTDGEAASALDTVLARMAQVVADLTHPDGFVAQFNDGGLHMAHAPDLLLAALQPVAPRPTFALCDAGYFGMRAGSELLVVDCGRIACDEQPAHAHGDILSFEWSVAGRRVVVDPGVSTYDQGRWRAYARSTSSHNTVALDGADQAEFWLSFRVGRRPDVTLEQLRLDADALQLTGSHNGFARLRGSPRHQRAIDASPGRVEIVDEILGGAGQLATARLLLHPAVTIETTTHGAFLHVGNVHIEVRTTASLSVTEAWWCPDLGVRSSTRSLDLTLGRAPCRAWTRLTTN